MNGMQSMLKKTSHVDFLHVSIYMYLSVVEEHYLMTHWYFYESFAYDTFVNGIYNKEFNVYGKHFYGLYFYRSLAHNYYKLRHRSMAPYFYQI